MRRSCAASSLLRTNTFLITCSGVATKFDVQTSRWNPAKNKMFWKGKRLRSQTKEVICGVYSYLESQAKRARKSSRVLERTAKATTVSRRTVARIRQEQKRLRDGDSFASPPKRYRRSRRRVISDDFDRKAIRRHIYCLYEQKVNITLDRLLVRLLLQFIFNAQHSIKHAISVAFSTMQSYIKYIHNIQSNHLWLLVAVELHCIT